MSEVNGNPKPTESVNVVAQNKKGHTKHKYRGQLEPAHSSECRFCGEYHEFRRNYVLHMAKGAVNVAGKIIMQKYARKKCQVRGM